MLLKVEVSSLDTHATVSPVGEVDLSSVELLATALPESIEGGAVLVTVDLDGVTYLDSAGLGALVGASKRLKAVGGSLALHCRQPRLLRLLTITGLDKVFTVDRSEPASAG